MSSHLESPDNSKILDATNNSMFGAQSQLSMPQLTIPPLPPMVAIPKPKPVKKLPPVGYDMRSLRKQMDILYNEIEDRAKWQDLVFKQNDALWNYTASLLESNQVNVETMKQQMSKLHIECVELHRERRKLIKKLADIQNAQQLINGIGDEINSIKNDTSYIPSEQYASNAHSKRIQDISTNDMNLLRFKAAEAIDKAKKDKEELDFEIDDKSGKLAHMKTQLDAYRDSLVEQANDDRADHFFTTNSVVLRNAYRRFRDSVKEKLKHHQITYALENVINSVFRAKYWKMWGFYMAKRRMMKHHVHRRKMVTRLLCLERWKVFVALEKHIRRAGQQCIIRHSFRTWQKYIADMVVVIPVSSQFLIGKVVKNDVYEANPTGGVIVIHKNECYYDNLIDTFQNKLLKRKLFRYWREVCLRRGRLGGRKVWNDGELSIAYSTDAYLPWNTDEIIRLENTIQPTRVFLTNLLKHWKRVARATSEYHSITLTSVQIPNVIQKFHFRAWRESCMQLWSHRSRLIFRFFDNIRTLTTRVKDERYLLQMGISHFVNRYVKLGFENWINFVRDKKRFGNSGQTMRMSMFGTESQTFGHSIRAGTSSIAMNFQSPRAGSTFSRLTTSELSGSYFHTTGLMDTAADSPRSRSGSGTEFDYDAPLTPAQATPQLSVYKPALSTVSLLDRSICTNYSLTFRNVKLMRCALKHWYNRSVIVRSRQVASEELAIKYNNHYLLTFNGLRTLYAHCRRSKHNRSVAHRPLYQFVFRSWKKYAMQMKQEKVHLRKLSKYLVKKKRTTRKHCLLAWINYNTYNRKCIECAHSVKLKNLYNYMRIGFKTWKYQWSHALYWKIKELHVENKKVTDLIALYNDELSQLDKEKDRIIATSETYQSQIVEYTQLLINKECVLQETELKFNKQKEETLELQMAVQEKETMLRNVEVERDRLVSVEQVLLEESKRQAELMERRKEESDRMIRQLQEETANLQSELRQLATGETRDANSKTGGELVYSLEHKVKKSTEEELKILRELVSFNDNLRLEEKAQQQKLQQLEELRSEINKEIGDIQHRFHVLESGGSGGDEYASCSNNKELMDDRVMTNKTLHLNHLEEQLRQCDGKVQSTLNAIEEKKLALKALKSDTISKIEKREMNELAALSARESRVISSHGIQVDGKEEAPLTTESILMSYVRDASPHSNHEGYGYTGHSSEDDAFANSASVSSESESDDESFQTCDANSDNGLGVQSQHGSSNAKKSNLASYYKAKASIRRVVDKLGSKT